MTVETPLDDVDRRIVLATQSGLPLAPQPYHVVALQVGPQAVGVRIGGQNDRAGAYAPLRSGDQPAAALTHEDARRLAA